MEQRWVLAIRTASYFSREGASPYRGDSCWSEASKRVRYDGRRRPSPTLVFHEPQGIELRDHGAHLVGDRFRVQLVLDGDVASEFVHAADPITQVPDQGCRGIQAVDEHRLVVVEDGAVNHIQH